MILIATKFPLSRLSNTNPTIDMLLQCLSDSSLANLVRAQEALDGDDSLLGVLTGTQ